MFTSLHGVRDKAAVGVRRVRLFFSHHVLHGVACVYTAGSTYQILDLRVLLSSICAHYGFSSLSTFVFFDDATLAAVRSNALTTWT